MLRFSSIVVLSLSLLLPNPAAEGGQTTSARPRVRLEKSRFSTAESVFFWVELTAADSPIPASLRNTGRVVITRPDGTQKIDVVGWPADGNPDMGGWSGGWGLRAEKSQLGRYTVVYEFAGRASDTVSFLVEDAPALKEITAEFVFPTPLNLAQLGVVTLIVRNGTREMVRFPYRGISGANVWVELKKTSEPRFSSSYFVLPSALIAAAGIRNTQLSADTFTWDLADRIPTVTLKPGEVYRLNVPLEDVLQKPKKADDPFRVVPGEYDLRLGTQLQILVGEPSGAWAPLSPLRINVESFVHAVLK